MECSTVLISVQNNNYDYQVMPLTTFLCGFSFSHWCMILGYNLVVKWLGFRSYLQNNFGYGKRLVSSVALFQWGCRFLVICSLNCWLCCPILPLSLKFLFIKWCSSDFCTKVWIFVVNLMPWICRKSHNNGRNRFSPHFIWSVVWCYRLLCLWTCGMLSPLQPCITYLADECARESYKRPTWGKTRFAL